jgi:hypothetical protein
MHSESPPPPSTTREEMQAVNNPEDPSAGTRKVPFGRALWIERDDFVEAPRPSSSASPRAARCARAGCVTLELIDPLVVEPIGLTLHERTPASRLRKSKCVGDELENCG